jgi:hypothetical protein
MTPITPLAAWHRWIEGPLSEGKKDAVPALAEEGSNERLLVVSGENGGGKSLVASVIGGSARRVAEEEGVKLEVMDIGMSRRTMPDISRVFIFGDEGSESTGNISMKAMLGALKTSRDRGHRHWVVLDEPDIGMGEGYHRAIGQHLAAFASAMPDNCEGLVVVSHSRAIVRELVDVGACSLRVGSDLRPVKEWVAHGDIPKTVDDLLALEDKVSRTYRKVANLISEMKATRKPETSGRRPR